MDAPWIETARLRLRPYRRADLDDLHRLWTDPDVRRYLFDGKIVPKERVRKEIENSIECFETHGHGQWAALDPETTNLIGFCGFRFFHDPPELQLLYGIAPSQWGQGLATEAAWAMIRYGFEELAFEQIIASSDAVNPASLRVMEKVGMSFVKRADINGIDTVYYAISREAFHASDPHYRVLKA